MPHGVLPLVSWNVDCVNEGDLILGKLGGRERTQDLHKFLSLF